VEGMNKRVGEGECKPACRWTRQEDTKESRDMQCTSGRAKLSSHSGSLSLLKKKMVWCYFFLKYSSYLISLARK
jgi:hypothetical protein